MSDFQQGADWWQASDGKWYPPQQQPQQQPQGAYSAPSHQQYAAGPPPKKGSGTKTALIVFGVLALLGVLGIGAIAVLAVAANNSDEEDSGGDLVAFCDAIADLDAVPQSERATEEHRDQLDELVRLAPSEIREETAFTVAAQKQLSEAAEFDEPIDPDTAVVARDGFSEARFRFSDFIEEKC